MKKMVLWLAAAAAAAGALALAVYFVAASPRYPQFTDTADGAPQSQWRMTRDYAARTGDIIEVELFVHQSAGSTVAVNSPTIEGDFELPRTPELTSRQNGDGSVTHRIAFTLQSLEVKPKVEMQVSFVWQKAGGSEQKEFKAPKLEIFTSNTYDGRPDLKEGEDPRPSQVLIWLRFAGPAGAALALYVVLSVWSLVKVVRKARQLTPEQMALARFKELLALVEAGPAEPLVHAELDMLARERFKLSCVPLSDLTQENNLLPVGEFLGMNALGIYPPTAPDDDKRQALVRFGKLVADGWHGMYLPASTADQSDHLPVPDDATCPADMAEAGQTGQPAGSVVSGEPAVQPDGESVKQQNQ